MLHVCAVCVRVRAFLVCVNCHVRAVSVQKVCVSSPDAVYATREYVRCAVCERQRQSVRVVY